MECGVDAVKLQKRDNRRLYTRELYDAPYDNEHSFVRLRGSAAPPPTLPVWMTLTRSQKLPIAAPAPAARATLSHRCRGCAKSATRATSGSAMSAVNFVPTAGVSASAECEVEPRRSEKEVGGRDEEGGDDDVVERRPTLENDHRQGQESERAERCARCVEADAATDPVST